MAEIINTVINREKVLISVQAREWDSGAGPRVNQRPGHRGWFCWKCPLFFNWLSFSYLNCVLAFQTPFMTLIRFRTFWIWHPVWPRRGCFISVIGQMSLMPERSWASPSPTCRRESSICWTLASLIPPSPKKEVLLLAEKGWVDLLTEVSKP